MRICYTPAHTKEEDGAPDERKHPRTGNSRADACAKRGRNLHAVAAETSKAYEDARGKIKEYVRRMGKAARAQGKDGHSRDARERGKADPRVLQRKEEEKRARRKERREMRGLVACRPAAVRTARGRAAANEAWAADLAVRRLPCRRNV